MPEDAIQERPATPSRLRSHLPLLAVCFVFVAARVVLIANSWAPSIDSVRYLSLGDLWASGRWSEALSSEYHPLYPFFLGLFTAPFRDPELPARLLSLLFSTLTLVPMYHLARDLSGRAAAILTLAVYALLPHPLRASVEILTEPLFLLLVVTQAACLVRVFKTWSWRWALCAGFAAGAAYLTRPEGPLPLLAFGLAVIWPGREAPGTWKRLLLPCAAAAAFLLPAGPYMAWTGGITAKKSPTRLAGAGEYRPDESPARSSGTPPLPLSPSPSRTPSLASWSMVGENPDHVARRDPVRGAVWKALHLFCKAGHFTSPFLVLLGFLFGRLFRRPWRGDLFLALIFVLNLALVCMLLWGYRYASLRHVLSATVLTLPLAGYAITELWRLAARRIPVLFRSLVLLWALAFTIFFCIQSLKPLHYNRRHLSPIGALIGAKAGPQDVMLSEDPRLAWYAGTGYVALGLADSGTVTRLAREQGVRFLVSERGELRRRVPDFGKAVDRGEWIELDLSAAGSWPGIEPVAFELRSP